jgi:FkbM family methyltransferase
MVARQRSSLLLGNRVSSRRVAAKNVRVDAGLIFDVGAANGDDTAHYVSRGFRVVAVEANPVVAARLVERFAAEIAASTVTVEQVGIWAVPGTRTFWVNDDDAEHSSFVEEVGKRSPHWHAIEVETVPFRSLLARHGVPYYLKVDIESSDQWCLRDLDPADKPAYVSVEAHRGWYLALLYGLGYNAFKCIDQTCHNRPFANDNETLRGRVRGRSRRYERRIRRMFGDSVTAPYPRGSSGPFGDDTVGEWQDFETVSYDWLHFRFGRRGRGTLNLNGGWYDFHATHRPTFDRY